jgi:hypothetical protein
MRRAKHQIHCTYLNLGDVDIALTPNLFAHLSTWQKISSTWQKISTRYDGDGWKLSMTNLHTCINLDRYDRTDNAICRDGASGDPEPRSP